MKTKLILILLVTGGIGFTFSGCKKSNDNAGPALTPKQVSSQIALNLTETLEDGFGAFGLSSGFSSAENLGLIPKGSLRLNDVNNPLCGTIADTTLNYTTNDAGTSASVQGTLKFAFTCTNNVLSGFNVTDNLAISESAPAFSVSYKLVEDLTETAVTPTNDATNVTLNGTLSFGGNYTYKTGSKGTGSANYSYTFHSITADDTGQLISGSADFTTSGTGSTGTWNYTGTVTFLGGNKANIVINGTTYNVDLTTGAVS